MWQIKLKKRTQPEMALHIVLLVSLWCGTLTDILSFPSAVKYIIDLMNVVLLVLTIMNLEGRKTFLAWDARTLLWWVLGFVLFTLIIYVGTYQSVLYYLWGLRNNFRFYVFFLACMLFFDKEDIADYLKLFDILFYINAAVCFIQFFLFGRRGDYLGGIFGIEKGCNAYLNIYLVIVVTKTVLYYLHQRESNAVVLLQLGLALVIAAFSELKFFFVEFILIVIGSMLLCKMSMRKIMIVVAGALGIVLTSTLLSTIFPVFRDFLSIDYFLESATQGGYSAAGTVNRLTTIPVISGLFLKDAPSQWFGLGLGNCDTSAFSFLNTPFFQSYSYLRYSWFSTAFVFLEMGYLGLIFFFGFFVLVAIKSYRISKRYPEDQILCQISLVAAVMCILIGIYNSSLRTEAAYPIYFVMTFPFILQKERVCREQETESEQLQETES